MSVPQKWPNNFQKLILNRLHLIGWEGRGQYSTVSKQNLERFSFREMLRNKIPTVFFYFCSTERNSELFFSSAKCSGTKFRKFSSIFAPRNGIPSCFLFCEMLQNKVSKVCFYFCSAKCSGTKFRKFASISVQRYGTVGIPSEITICFVYSVFRGIFFMSEIGNPSVGALKGPKHDQVGYEFFYIKQTPMVR